MALTYSRLTHALRKLCGDPFVLSQGHAEQLVAAALGYGSLASYQVALWQGSEPSDFSGVEHVVFDEIRLADRVNVLGVPIGNLPELLLAAAQDTLPKVKVYRSADAFEENIREVLMFDAANGESASGPIAMTNPDGIDEIYLPFDLDLRKIPIGVHHVIKIQGHVNMRIDIDRPYSGHHIDVDASVAFTRLGLALFADFSAGVEHAVLDYDW